MCVCVNVCMTRRKSTDAGCSTRLLVTMFYIRHIVGTRMCQSKDSDAHCTRDLLGWHNRTSYNGYVHSIECLFAD